MYEHDKVVTDEIVTVKGAHLLIKGGDREVIVKLSDLEYCITAIRLSQGHKASIYLERIVAHASAPQSIMPTEPE